MAFRSFTVVFALLSAVLAQSSSNPFIPTGISANCTQYLTTLDTESTFTSCTSPFTTALQAFTPTSNTTTPSSSTILNALNTLCATNAFSACPQNTVAAQLASFYAACSDELISTPNQSVKLLYDLLYSLVPLRTAVCSKDDNGNYCAAELSNSSSVGTVAAVDTAASQKQTLLSQYLYSQTGTDSAPARRDLANTTTALVPNATTFQDTNLLFMFLNGGMSNSELCVTCTRNILTPYITFESAVPYGPGINSSLILAGQITLYNNVTSKCGSSFLSGAVQAAGGLSNGLLSGAAPRAGGLELSAAVSAILGVAAFMAAAV